MRHIVIALAIFVAIALVTVWMYYDIPSTQTSCVGCAGEELWDTLNSDQLSWVIEGFQERISKMEDELECVQRIQSKKIAEKNKEQCMEVASDERRGQGASG